jgi:hypothetical protein
VIYLRDRKVGAVAVRCIEPERTSRVSPASQQRVGQYRASTGQNSAGSYPSSAEPAGSVSSSTGAWSSVLAAFS